jgi:hypothetical protein
VRDLATPTPTPFPGGYSQQAPAHPSSLKKDAPSNSSASCVSSSSGGSDAPIPDSKPQHPQHPQQQQQPLILAPPAIQGKENRRATTEAAQAAARSAEKKTPTKSKKQRELEALAFSAAGSAWKIGDDAGPAVSGVPAVPLLAPAHVS